MVVYSNKPNLCACVPLCVSASINQLNGGMEFHSSGDLDERSQHKKTGKEGEEGERRKEKGIT